MLPFRVHIIGCCSAIPTLRHNPSAQVINFHDRLFLIDCGEGTQRELIRQRIPIGRIGHVFISHLHGDHFYGLPGLLNTLSLSGVSKPLHVYAFAPLQHMLAPLLNYHKRSADEPLIFHPVSEKGFETIYEDKELQVSTLPLHHGVPCVGYVFREKHSLPHIRKDKIADLHIPHTAIAAIKAGGDWTDAQGTHHRHASLVTPADAPRTYVYMTDTRPCHTLAKHISGANLLYHEATYASDCTQKALEYCHSTAAEAAAFAKQSNVKRLLIGHYSDRYASEQILLDEAQPIFTDTQAAQEGMTIDV